MKIRTSLFPALLLTVTLLARAQGTEDPIWFLFHDSDEAAFFLKKGSLETERKSIEGETASAIIRIDSKTGEKPVTFYKLKVTRNDCHREYGSLWLTNLSDSGIQRFDFVKDGGNVASEIAIGICRALKDRDKRDSAAAAADSETPPPSKSLQKK